MIKKLLLTISIIASFATMSISAEEVAVANSNSPFIKGTSLLSLKIGTGTDYYFNYSRRDDHYNNGNSPVFALAYEKGISDLLGIGYIGLGVEGGYGHGKHYSNRYWASEADIFHLGVITNYHFDFHTITQEPVFTKIDLYAGLGFFFRQENRYATESTNRDFDGRIQYNRSGYIFNACIGGRYFFNDRVSAMLQIGSSLSHADFGVTFKL